MRDGPLRIGLWLSAAVTAAATWLVIGTGHDNAYLGPFVALGALACVAGWRGDRVAALAIYLGGIVGATVVAWAADAVGVEPGADPAMRSSYHAMLVIVAAGVSVVLGSVIVGAGYLMGRLARTRAGSRASQGSLRLPRLRSRSRDPIRGHVTPRSVAASERIAGGTDPRSEAGGTYAPEAAHSPPDGSIDA